MDILLALSYSYAYLRKRAAGRRTVRLVAILACLSTLCLAARANGGPAGVTAAKDGCAEVAQDGSLIGYVLQDKLLKLKR